ncbi:MAG: hypothetical protein ABIQ84_10040 [Usitatibacter sp.]
MASRPYAAVGLHALWLNFAWEMLQAPWFVGMLDKPWWDATAECLRAAGGDAVMILIAFATVSLPPRATWWMDRPARAPLAAYLILAALQGLALEWFSLRAGRWSYLPEMPVEPILGLGLAPILQWLTLPAAALWMARRGDRARAS